MKKFLFVGLMTVVMFLLGSCGGGKQQQQEETSLDISKSVDLGIMDSTLYGVCSDGTAMNTLEMITDNGDTLTFDMAKAQEDGKVFGGLQVDDRVAVVANKANTEAHLVINLNTLMGDWVMPDPFDGSAEIGIRIKDGSVAENINQSAIIYRKWKIFNGNLDLLLVREGDGDEEEENLFEILTLGPDTLAFRTIGKPSDETETFEYRRWKHKPKADLHGLGLEKTNKKFNKI